MRFPQPVFSHLADKVTVRFYIENVIGERYLVPLISVHDDIDESVIESMPRAFVMKSNHSCHQVKIVTDKNNEDPAALVRLATSWLDSDYSKVAGEKHYKAIKPKVLFEHALLTNGVPPDDYKVYFFNPGRPGLEGPSYAVIQHIHGRFDKVSQVFYTSDWEKMALKRRGEPNTGLSPRPQCLEEMLGVSAKLSKGLGFVRVDFYVFNGRLYVGELTLTPVAGVGTFDPEGWDQFLGEKFGWPEDMSEIEAIFGFPTPEIPSRSATLNPTDRQATPP